MGIRVQTASKAGTTYVSVVQDYYEDGHRRIRTLQSFGPQTPESLARAYQFKASCEAVLALQETVAEADLEKVAILVFGLILGAAVIALLLGDD